MYEHFGFRKVGGLYYLQIYVAKTKGADLLHGYLAAYLLCFRIFKKQVLSMINDAAHFMMLILLLSTIFCRQKQR